MFIQCSKAECRPHSKHKNFRYMIQNHSSVALFSKLFTKLYNAQIWTSHSIYYNMYILQITKALEHDNIHKLCLCLKEEHTCQILNFLHVSELRDRVHKHTIETSHIFHKINKERQYLLDHN